MTETNTSQAIYVLGDESTAEHLDVLLAKAAEHGAVIGKAFAFGSGEAACADDLSTVDAVVEALGRAIAKRRPIWLPWWQDLAREQHLRALSLALQRHGIDLLIGPQLAPVPVDGGMNQMDAAMRNEIRGVFRLDDAAMAAAGMTSLGTEIEEFLSEVGPVRAPVDEPVHAQHRERRFSTAETAALLGKSPQWVSRGVRAEAFRYADGSVVEALRHRNGNRRVFTAAMIRAIAWSAYRRGTLSPQRLEEVLADLRSER